MEAVVIQASNKIGFFLVEIWNAVYSHLTYNRILLPVSVFFRDAPTTAIHGKYFMFNRFCININLSTKNSLLCVFSPSKFHINTDIV